MSLRTTDIMNNKELEQLNELKKELLIANDGLKEAILQTEIDTLHQKVKNRYREANEKENTKKLLEEFQEQIYKTVDRLADKHETKEEVLYQLYRRKVNVGEWLESKEVLE